MFDNIIENQGFIIALSGILVVFSGLMLIAIVIHIFNKIFEKSAKGSSVFGHNETDASAKTIKAPKGKPIPADHLTAIAVALEIYHKLYYEVLESKVTFKRGEGQSGWKMGAKFDQRANFLR